MSETEAIAVAGVRIATTNTPLPAWLRPWASKARAAELRLTVRHGRPLAAPGIPVRFCDGKDDLEISFLRGRFHLVTRAAGGSVARSASLDAQGSEVEIVMGEGHGGDPFDRGLLEWLALNRLARKRGFVLSACGIIRDGRALVFAGGPGSGRTTAAELLRRHTRAHILSDDRIAIHESRGLGFVATAWPWPEEGAFRGQGSGALQVCHCIRRAPFVLAEPLVGESAREALSRVTLRPVGDGEAGAKIDAALDRCAHAIPTVRLGFPPDVRLARYAGGESTPTTAPLPPAPEAALP